SGAGAGKSSIGDRIPSPARGEGQPPDAPSLFTSGAGDTKGPSDVHVPRHYRHPETDPRSRGGQGRAGLTDTPTRPCGERGAGLLRKTRSRASANRRRIAMT